MINIQLGKRLKAAREDAGLKPKDVAEHLGISRAAISQWERGENAPKFDHLTAIAALYGVTSEALIGETGSSVTTQRGRAGPPANVTPASEPGDTMPLYGSAEAGADGAFILSDPIGDVRRPPQLIGVRNPAPFGVRVEGYSMEPKYSPGATLWIDPSQPAIAGDHVLIELDNHGERRALVKKMIGRDDKSIHVRQYNPPKEWKIPLATIARIYLIAGNSERGSYP